MGRKTEFRAVPIAGHPERFDYEGMREASGAIAVPEGSFGKRFLVVNNEDNRLRFYVVGSRSEVLPGIDIRPSRKKAWRDIDLEAATWLNGRAVFVGSLGRNDHGKPRPERQKLISIKLEVTDKAVQRTGRILKSSKLLPELSKLDALKTAIGDLTRRKRKLSPKRNGINLEGLTTGADGTSLMLGFRNPLRDGKALVVRLRNPEAVLRKKERPKLDQPYELSLEGLGIRSIDYCAQAGGYFIVAGPTGSGSCFDIFHWKEGGKPCRVAGAAEALRRLKTFTPEGLIVDPGGTRLLLFGDNGGDKGKRETFPSLVLAIQPV